MTKANLHPNTGQPYCTRHSKCPASEKYNQPSSNLSPATTNQRTTHKGIRQSNGIRSKSRKAQISSSESKQLIFSGLRELVPSLKDKKAASKVEILKEARGYICSLQKQLDHKLASTAARQKAHQFIKNKMSESRRNLAIRKEKDNIKDEFSTQARNSSNPRRRTQRRVSRNHLSQ